MSSKTQTYLRKMKKKNHFVIYNVNTKIYSSFYNTYLFIKCYPNINFLCHVMINIIYFFKKNYKSKKNY